MESNIGKTSEEKIAAIKTENDKKLVAVSLLFRTCHTFVISYKSAAGNKGKRAHKTDGSE